MRAPKGNLKVILFADYCHQIEVEIDNTPVIFKLDKRSHYQAVIIGLQPGKNRPSTALVKTIAKGLDQLLKAHIQPKGILL